MTTRSQCLPLFSLFRASRAASDAKKEASKFWDTFSSNPEYWASTLASVNLLLLGGLGVYAYVKRDEVKHTDRRVIGGVVAGVAGLIGAQSCECSASRLHYIDWQTEDHLWLRRSRNPFYFPPSSRMCNNRLRHGAGQEAEPQPLEWCSSDE